MQKTTPARVRSKKAIKQLLLRMDSNVHDFAVRHEFCPRLVLSAIDRYVGRPKKPRAGSTTHLILTTLATEIGKPILPSQ